MLQYDPTHRLSLEEVRAHPWYNGPVPDYETIRKDFERRKKMVDKQNMIQT